MVDKSNLYLTFKIHLYYALQSIIFFVFSLIEFSRHPSWLSWEFGHTSSSNDLKMIHVLIVSSDPTKQASTDADGCSNNVHTPTSTNQNFSSDRQSHGRIFDDRSLVANFLIIK